MQLMPLDTFVVKLKCNKAHLFHPECMDDWARHNYTCPCCRKAVIDNEDEILRYLNAQRRNTVNQLEDPLGHGIL